MIELLPYNNSELVAFRLGGTVSSDDIDAIAKILEQKFESEDHVDLYIELDEDFEESFGAILGHAKVGFSVILPNLGKIKKAAFVSDKSWVGKIADFKDMFFSIDVRGFPLSEEEFARIWVCE